MADNEPVVLTPTILRYIVSKVSSNVLRQLIAEKEVTLAVLKTSQPILPGETRKAIDQLFFEAKKITEIDLKDGIQNLIEKTKKELEGKFDPVKN